MRAFLTVPHFAGIYQQTKLHFYRHYNKKPKQKKANKGQNKGNRIKKQILSNDSYPFSLTLILENLYKQIMSHSKTSIGVNFTFTV